MDIYQRSLEFFLSLPVVSSWQDLQDLYCRAVARQPAHWRLPLFACQAVGGSSEQAIPAMTAVACAHIGILLVDDMLDSDPRGEYQQMGMPAVANMASAFQAAALSALASGILDASSRQMALDVFNHMFLLTAYGQFLDVQIPSDEDAFWQVVRTKSAPFFGAAFQMGALIGGTSLKVSQRLNLLGRLYGEMIQIHDDLHDVMECPANSDWVQGRRPLPILFAALVRHPQQAHFLDLTRNIHEAGALEEAQNILFQCGAVSYCMKQLLQKHQAAQAILDGLQLEEPETMTVLLEDIIAPVKGLLEAADHLKLFSLGRDSGRGNLRLGGEET